MEKKPAILIVGASRGLGLALVEQFCLRGWQVLATVRTPSSALDALKVRFGSALEEEVVDIADEASVRALRQRLEGRTLEMLFINAGIAKSINESAGTAPVQDFLDMMLVNAFSPMRFIEIFDDMVAPDGTVHLGLFGGSWSPVVGWYGQVLLDPWTGTKVTTDYDAYGKHGIPLYTAPQPVEREPLPSVEIMRIILEVEQQHNVLRGTTNWAAAVGRAIEAAHGIKGGQHG